MSLCGVPVGWRLGQVVHHVTWGAEGEGHGIHKARLSCASQGPASRTLALLDGSVWVSCSCAVRCHLPDTPHPEGLFLEGHPLCRPPPCLPPFGEKLYLMPRETCRPRLAWGLWGQSSEAGLMLLGLPFHFDLSRLHFGPVQRALLQAPWGLGCPLSRAQGLGKWLTWPPLVLKGGMCLGEPARGRHKVGVQVCPDHSQALGLELLLQGATAAWGGLFACLFLQRDGSQLPAVCPETEEHVLWPRALATAPWRRQGPSTCPLVLPLLTRLFTRWPWPRWCLSKRPFCPPSPSPAVFCSLFCAHFP